MRHENYSTKSQINYYVAYIKDNYWYIYRIG